MTLLKRSQPSSRPVRVMQFGEGNFLRAFIDWMIQRLDYSCGFDAQVQIIQPLPKGNADIINAQGGLYTLILRGIENGKPVEKRQIIDVVNGCLNPYENWDATVKTACLPTLRFVFSNTTEAGIEYKPEPYTPGQCQNTYPAKLTSLLFQRYNKFNGDPKAGLLIIPCELIDKNGANLKNCILKYAADWALPDAFIEWLNSACTFFNTLVDRIVAGYPADEAADIQAKIGYEDKIIDCGEIFHFFVIEGPKSLAQEFPFEKAGLQVVITDNQTPYRTRKVRFLNGAHTCSIPAAILSGLTLVDEMMADKDMGPFVNDAVFNEIFPTVQLPDEEKSFFAASVMERFRNPFAKHRLLSISLNSISKWKVRVLPSLLDYTALKGELPKRLAFSLAALLRFYQLELIDGQAAGNAGSFTYPVSDSPEVLDFFAKETEALKASGDTAAFVQNALANTAFWEQNLNEIPGLAQYVIDALADIDANGIRNAVANLAK